ncbi:formylglycine-generating enzyme family protein [Stenotrophomonas indicatrix]|uniref:formylglycine-generating enzyme family protein n=2 Tax=Stenotrophomonas TaxID=40323 RepID=UPI003CCE8249
MRSYRLWPIGILALLPLAPSACAGKPANSAHQAQEREHAGASLQEQIIQDLVRMKGGTFLMGDFGPVHNADKLPYSGETNDDVLRKITLSDFSITAHKISVEQYDAFSDSTGQPRIGTSEIDAGLYRKDVKASAGVSWTQAQEFCAWLGSKTGKRAALPTEAEWEYAARSGGKMEIYATDNGRIDDGRNVASFDQNMDGSGVALGKYPPNPAGLYDMIDHGHEWVQDWYEASYTGKDLRDPQGPKSGSEKVIRSSTNQGGDSLALVSMTFTRASRAPDMAARKDPKGRDIEANQNYGYGFRCVVHD